MRIPALTIICWHSDNINISVKRAIIQKFDTMPRVMTYTLGELSLACVDKVEKWLFMVAGLSDIHIEVLCLKRMGEKA